MHAIFNLDRRTLFLRGFTILPTHLIGILKTQVFIQEILIFVYLVLDTFKNICISHKRVIDIYRFQSIKTIEQEAVNIFFIYHNISLYMARLITLQKGTSSSCMYLFAFFILIY